MNKKQQKASRNARRILLAMDMKKQWQRILTRISPRVDANTTIRFKSFAAALKKVVY